jgi:ribA/ribD-fused uncharacterized protein
MSGYYATIGRRSSMEDTVAVHITDSDEFYGVFDGHGGDCFAKELRKSFLPYLAEVFDAEKPGESIEKAFLDFNELLCKKLENSKSTGSTAVVFIKHGNELYCANVGDSEAILVNESARYVEITTPHKPDYEIDRIKATGAEVFLGRINGMIAISRSFGDERYEGAVIAKPAVWKATLQGENRHVILASDGLWDTMRKDEVCKHSLTSGSVGNNGAGICRFLAEKAIKRNSNDNIAVMLISLCSESRKCEGETVLEHVGQSKIPPPMKPVQDLIPHVKSLQERITEPMFFLDTQQQTLCKAWFGERAPPLPCWVSQRAISFALFGGQGVNTVNTAIRARGAEFVWATEFSNMHATYKFIEPELTIDGIKYRTIEHYYQLQKISNTENEENIRKYAMHDDVGSIMRYCKTVKIRSDWDEYRIEVMRRGLRAKFFENELLKALLLSTGTLKLVDIKPNDGFWGSGIGGLGKNKLGELLMELRAELRR